MAVGKRFQALNWQRSVPVLVLGMVLLLFSIWVWIEPESGIRIRLFALVVFAAWFYTAWTARRVVTTEDLEEAHQSWRYLAVATWIWTAAYAIDGAAILLYGQSLPTPSVSDLLRLAGYLAALSFAISYPVSPPDRFGRLRDALDIAILSLATITLSWLVLVQPILTSGVAGPSEAIWLTVDPVLDTMLIVLILRLLLINSQRFEFPVFRTLTLAFLSLLLSDFRRSLQVISREPGSSLVVMIGLLLAIALIWQAFRTLARGHGLQSGLKSASRRQDLGIKIDRMLPLALTYLVVGVTAVDWSLSGNVQWLAIVSAALLIMMLFARQGVIAGQQEMHQFAELVNATADLAFVCDNQGVIHLSNPALQRVIISLGRSEQDLNVADLISAETYIGGILQEAAEGGWSGEVMIRDAHGIVFPAILSLNPFQEVRRSEVWFAGTAHDLTPIREREERLREAMDEIELARQELARLNLDLERKVELRTEELKNMVSDLERLNEDLRALDRLKSEFVALVSHELRAPLTNIRSGVELIIRQYPDMDQSAMASLSLVEKETELLATFVKTILDLSALEAGRFDLDLAPQDLSGIADSVLIRIGAERTAGRIEIDLPDDIPDVFGDERALESVFYHLFDNALKYAPEGEIRVSGWQVGSNVFFSISDQGPGIPPGERERVFEMFHRLDSTDSREVYGYGLGLPMSRRLLEAMHGGVKIEENDSGGTKIVCWLPIVE